MHVEILLNVNEKPVTANVPAQTLLVELLREELGLTGTHVGCNTAQCGACTVHMDGRAVKSCSFLAVQARGSKVRTIEALATHGGLHPLQAAFQRCHALQCGYCTPGMVMASLQMLQAQDPLSEGDIREGLEGNLCRCTGYDTIVEAVQQVANNHQEN